jgi:outer membrane murein-binding lipoprotein Lpp
MSSSIFGLSTAEVSTLFVIFSSIGAAWLNARISIAKLQVQVQNIKEEIEAEKENNERAFDKIDKKLDTIHDKIDRLTWKK